MLKKYKESILKYTLTPIMFIYGFCIYMPYFLIARWLEKRRDKKEQSMDTYIMTQEEMDNIIGK